MIKTHSDDPDLASAATQALRIVTTTLAKLPKADSFDYGGHNLQLGEYEVCTTCASSIAEAQQAAEALRNRATGLSDPLVKEHLELAAQLFEHEAAAAVIRAEFHNGVGTEKILNLLLGYQFERAIHDQYQHSHQQGA